MTSLNEGKSKDEIAQRFGLDKNRVSEILEFLIKAGLCKVNKGKYTHHLSRTHLEKTSPYLKQHHANWRIKSIQKMDMYHDENLSFTAPLSLSNKDFNILREEMVHLIKKISDTVKDTAPEEVFCFTLDFFKI